jgi:hypothetical protein
MTLSAATWHSISSNPTPILVLFDFFPTSHEVIGHLDTLPGIYQEISPNAPIYSVASIAATSVFEIDLLSTAITIHEKPGYSIPVDCPLHPTHFYGQHSQHIQVLTSFAHQFDEMNGLADPVLVRQGSCLVMFGHLWILEFVVFTANMMRLFYHMDDRSVPVMLGVEQPCGRNTGTRGHFQLVELRER